MLMLSELNLYFDWTFTAPSPSQQKPEVGESIAFVMCSATSLSAVYLIL